MINFVENNLLYVGIVGGIIVILQVCDLTRNTYHISMPGGPIHYNIDYSFKCVKFIVEIDVLFVKCLCDQIATTRLIFFKCPRKINQNPYPQLAVSRS